MNLEFSPEDLAFRDEVRAFIEQNYPESLRGKQDEGDDLTKEDFLAWHKVLAKKGWVAPSWPKEWGGTDWTSTQKYIFSEETARADAIAELGILWSSTPLHDTCQCGAVQSRCQWGGWRGPGIKLR